MNVIPFIIFVVWWITSDISNRVRRKKYGPITTDNYQTYHQRDTKARAILFIGFVAAQALGIVLWFFIK